MSRQSTLLSPNIFLVGVDELRTDAMVGNLVVCPLRALRRPPNAAFGTETDVVLVDVASINSSAVPSMNVNQANRRDTSRRRVSTLHEPDPPRTLFLEHSHPAPTQHRGCGPALGPRRRRGHKPARRRCARRSLVGERFLGGGARASTRGLHRGVDVRGIFCPLTKRLLMDAVPGAAAPAALTRIA